MNTSNITIEEYDSKDFRRDSVAETNKDFGHRILRVVPFDKIMDRLRFNDEYMSIVKEEYVPLQPDKITDIEKPFACAICDAKFVLEGFLKRHILLQHQLSFQCYLCSKFFRNRFECKKHFKKFHMKKMLKCDHDQCTYSTSIFYNLTIHKQSHSGILERRFKCKLCPAAFSRKSRLDNHQVIHFDTRSFECDICKYQSKTFSTLRKHIITIHVGKKRYKCEICQVGISCKLSLENHLNNEHIERPFKYKRCDDENSRSKHVANNHPPEHPFKCIVEKCCRNFKSKQALYAHLLIHCRGQNFQKINYKCDICGSHFKHKLLFEFHQQNHPDKSPFKCNTCNASFTLAGNLRRHQKIVHATTEERPYQCDICSEAFKTSSTLNGHKLIHTTNRPFKCEICNTSFKTSGTLKEHHAIHLTKKLFTCRHCDMSFRSQKYLNSHVRRVHIPKDKCYECDICSNKFKFKALLAQHMICHYNNRPFQCELCPSTFKSKFHIKIHQKTHETRALHNCDMCSSTFNRIELLSRHKKYVHSTEDISCKCTLCNKTLKNHNTLRTHMKSHEKAYRCDYEQCDKKCTTQYLLSLHIKRMHQDERNFKCELCLKCLKTSTDLQVHLRRHLLGTLKCKFCTNVYSFKQTLENHEKLHLNNQIRYSCDICLNTFSHKPSMKAHITNHARLLRK